MGKMRNRHINFEKGNIMLNNSVEDKDVVATYWGDIIIYPLMLMALIMGTLFIYQGVDELLMTMTIIQMILISFVLLYALYRFIVKKNRKLRNVFYVVGSLLLLLMLIKYYNTVFIQKDLVMLVNITEVVKWVTSNLVTARVTIWLYLLYQRKQAEKDLAPTEPSTPPTDEATPAGEEATPDE